MSEEDYDVDESDDNGSADFADYFFGVVDDDEDDADVDESEE